ncbi:MAG: oxidoreductase [Pseudomonadota bacterium]
MESFKAYRVFEEDGQVAGRLVGTTLDQLDPGEVVVRVEYSSVNYKDALGATGKGRVIRRFPCVGGVDLAGTVVSSDDAHFRAGDAVLATGYDLGVAHDGGFAEYARVPADWLVPLPAGLTLFDAMALGTAGFTAAKAIYLLELNGLAPGNGKVAVSGASGGVASLLIDMLAARGYVVTAITGKDSEHDYLRHLGAAEILPRSAIQPSDKALEKGLWVAAFDAVGGDTLAWFTRTMAYNGLIASFGNTGGTELHTTVFPFILRGVRLIGVDSAQTAMPLRLELWRRIASDLRPRHLAEVTRTVTLDDLPQAFAMMLAGQSRGRTVVRILS